MSEILICSEQYFYAFSKWFHLEFYVLNKTSNLLNVFSIQCTKKFLIVA